MTRDKLQRLRTSAIVYWRSIGIAIIGIVTIVSVLHPFASMYAGHLFFGGSKHLYNVAFAQFFYTYASDPLIFKAPPFAYYQLSRTYFITGDLPRAVTEAETELSLYPENKRTYYILGLTYGYMKETEKAIEAFQMFIDWKPESWAARNDRAWLQFQVGDIDGALKTMEPIAGLTQNPWVQNTYGTLLLNKDRIYEARHTFKYAESAAEEMTGEVWGSAYPGNDPRIYDEGLSGMRETIRKNVELTERMIKAQEEG